MPHTRALYNYFLLQMIVKAGFTTINLHNVQVSFNKFTNLCNSPLWCYEDRREQGPGICIVVARFARNQKRRACNAVLPQRLACVISPRLTFNNNQHLESVDLEQLLQPFCITNLRPTFFEDGAPRTHGSSERCAISIEF